MFVAQIVKQSGLQVAFGGAGEDGDDGFAAILLLARLLHGSPGDRAAADADGEALDLH